MGRFENRRAIDVVDVGARSDADAADWAASASLM